MPDKKRAKFLVSNNRARHIGPVSVAIQGELPESIATSRGCKLSEVRSVASAVHQRAENDLSAPRPQVSKLTRARLCEHFHVGQLDIVAAQASKLDPFMKFALRTSDNNLIETVRIPLERPGRYSVCVSTQIGCNMGCRFCKTTQDGWRRNLAAWEIVEQVRLVRQSLPAGSRISGVVFQGMGEPLANIDAVIQAVLVLSHPACQAIDQRNITICTSGIARGISMLREANLRVRVGLSIGSAISLRRAELMPIEQKIGLASAVDALIEYVQATGYAPMLAYTMLSGVNCGTDDANALRQLALEIGQRSGRMPRVSLVAYNPIGEADVYRRASDEESEQFRAQLVSAGFPVVRRYSGGSDIDAACGQLAAQRQFPQ